MNPIERIGHSPINDDSIGYTDWYDFSTSNFDEEHRVRAVTTVASICYQSDAKIGSKVLYDRLAAESIGLPSSSFEFVPVLLNEDNLARFESSKLDKHDVLDIFRFGEVIYYEGRKYLITNLRALISSADKLTQITKIDQSELKHIYNTEDDASIIREVFYVFKHKVDLNTRSQMVRHRLASWQELSRRYVSGKKVPFEFYKKGHIMAGVGADVHLSGAYVADVFVSTDDLFHVSSRLYDVAVKNMAAQDARRLIPQAMYTELWSAWTPRGLKNFLDLRLDSHAQAEIRDVAEAMEFYTSAYRRSE